MRKEDQIKNKILKNSSKRNHIWNLKNEQKETNLFWAKDNRLAANDRLQKACKEARIWMHKKFTKIVIKLFVIKRKKDERLQTDKAYKAWNQKQQKTAGKVIELLKLIPRLWLIMNYVTWKLHLIIIFIWINIIYAILITQNHVG